MMDKDIDNAFVSGKTYADFYTGHALYTRLRNEDPVRWMQPDGFRPFWAVTKLADVMDIEKQHERFLNAPRQRLLSIEFETKVKEVMAGRPNLTKSMHLFDGEAHRAYRQITNNWFLPKQVQLLEQRISALAKTAVDGLQAMGSQCDFYKDVAVWYPLHVIMLILGLPAKDAKHLQRLTSSVFGGSDPEMQTAGDAISATMEFRAYFDGVAADRRNNPTDDVASLIANAMIDGRPIEEYESSSYYIALATAGHDTTSASMAGGILALIQNPAEWRKLQADPSLLDSAIEEMIRWVSPIKHFFRTAAQDCEVRGRQIKAGDNMMMVYPSANRDEEAFGDPFAFRVDRKPNRHVGFGYGVHMCLGMMLAKFEMKILLRELLARVDHFELNGQPKWVETAFIGGLKQFPVKFRMKEDAMVAATA
ncbi:cytochrome P450 [soil metagenome]